jgi:hypothetical protein
MKKLEVVFAQESAALSGNWEEFKKYFAPDVSYRVGNTVELKGPQAIADWLIMMLSTQLAINDLQVRTAWETPDAAILELNMKGLRMLDDQNVAYPCIDVYRFNGDKIQDWKVYAIEPTFVA